MRMLRWDAGGGRETTFSFGVALYKPVCLFLPQYASHLTMSITQQY